MRKIAIISMVTLLLSACATGQQVEEKAAVAFEKENKLWADMGATAVDICPQEVSRKTQVERQDCLEGLILKQVQPHVSYPYLVDYMLDKTRKEAEKYAKGEISKEAYTQNVNNITKDYWNNWQRAWDTKIESAYATQDNGRAFGQMLLGGINGYNAGVRKRQEEAASRKTLHCTTYGNSTTCNEY